MVYFMIMMDRLCFATIFDAMKECDALESNKMVAGCEFARNIPNTKARANNEECLDVEQGERHVETIEKRNLSWFPMQLLFSMVGPITWWDVTVSHGTACVTFHLAIFLVQ
jgi:hypothetical protein